MLYYSLSADSILGGDELFHNGFTYKLCCQHYLIFIGYNYSNIEVFHKLNSKNVFSNNGLVRVLLC